VLRTSCRLERERRRAEALPAAACRGRQGGDAAGGELVGEELLDLSVRGVPGRCDRACERLDRRPQHLPRAKVLGRERHQRRRGVVLDRTLLEPPGELLAVQFGRAAPAEVLQHKRDVVAARLRPSAVGQQLVRRRVDLAGDERRRVLRDRRQVVRDEAEEPECAQRHREPEAVGRAALREHELAVSVGEREACPQHHRPGFGRGSVRVAGGPRSFG
jgi:hypothetical protein